MFEYSDSDEYEWVICLKGVTQDDLDAMPKPTDNPGLDLKRQWYLYGHIRPHCKLTQTLKPSGSTDTPASTTMNTKNGPPPAKKRLSVQFV